MEHELVRLICNNSIGYYTQFKDAMKPGDVIFGEASVLPEQKPKENKSIKYTKKRKVKK
ncbi:MAG: hypothetical protein ABIL58_19545 [Pseudomonadota bacterium]